jgi:hypothetical protein
LISSFPIYRVEPKDRYGTDTGVDTEGRFYKYWCNHPELGHCLFKAASPDGFTPRERRWDWSEKVAAELGKLLGLPIARTELAIGYAQELGGYVDGTLSLDYTPMNGQAMSCRRFLSIVDPLYEVESLDGLDAYNVENVLHYLQTHSVGLPLNWHPPLGIENGADVMVGYLLFDALISATDRHDENLELAILEAGYFLCPTFDHGDSLGVKLLAESRSTGNLQDPKLVESCWWQNLTVEGRVEAVEISNIDAFNIAAKLRPMAAIVWLKMLTQIKTDDIHAIFEQLPAERIDKVTSQFTIDLLDFNLQNLLSGSERLVVEQPNIDVQEDLMW